MKQQWLENILEAIADRGREFLKLQPADKSRDHLRNLCDALVTDRGQASALALSREILRAYQGLTAEQRMEFFELLHSDYGPDPEKIQAAAQHYAQSHSQENYLRLNAAVEPPRQNLFRRLNMAAQGTATLVAMRGELLGILKQRPHLESVDADLKHLLASWFNPGFLQLERIDWRSPAEVLEKLISYEAVHEITDWDDLRRRLMADRRCYAFFHPAMPEVPLIFVEVALVKGMSDQVQDLLAPDSAVLDPAEADTAMFYSINNTQDGLRGISLGNFLIKQVLAILSEELPALSRFATISPLPGFAAAVRGERPGLEREMLDSLLEDFTDSLAAPSGIATPGEALLAILDDAPQAQRDILIEPLTVLALAYLTLPGPGGALDPVASFHLTNGASLERINTFADTSPGRMKASFGVMVNYLYEPHKIEKNHESFVTHGEIAMSKNLARIYKRIIALRKNQSGNPPLQGM